MPYDGLCPASQTWYAFVTSPGIIACRTDGYVNVFSGGHLSLLDVSRSLRARTLLRLRSLGVGTPGTCT